MTSGRPDVCRGKERLWLPERRWPSCGVPRVASTGLSPVYFVQELLQPVSTAQEGPGDLAGSRRYGTVRYDGG
jgi:hypothetical protein